MIALVLAAPALAWDWDGGPGSTINYHLVPSDFTLAEETAVETAFEAWNAGTGEILRGADMQITRDTDDAGGAVCNLKNEVFMGDQTYFDNHGWPGIARYQPCAGSHDIVFNSDNTWCTTLDSDCTSGDSIGQAAVHEMGHWVGFGHEDDNLATMNSVYPAGGDLGDTAYRIHEDDYDGLIANRPHASTGNNLMVAKYTYDGAGSSHEIWNSSEGTWTFDRSSDTWTGGDSPDPIQVVINGTATSLSPLVEWRLSSNTICSTSDYLIGSRTPSVSTNTPYQVGPTSWTLADTVPTGFYYLCVTVDSNTAITETSEADNDVVSDKQVQVVP